MSMFTCECLTCGAILDYIGSYNDPVPGCPECSNATKRVITKAPSFRLNGVGWARDGYSETQREIDSVSDKAESASHKRRMKKGRSFS